MSPANVPMKNASTVLTTGDIPPIMNFANMNAPIGNVPSADISAKSNILNVIDTPMANTAKINPCSTDVNI